LIKRSFQGLLGAIETVRIVKELMEIWLNKVCDSPICRSDYLKFLPVNQETHDLTSLHQVKGAEHVAQCSLIQHKIEKGAASKDK